MPFNGFVENNDTNRTDDDRVAKEVEETKDSEDVDAASDGGEVQFPNTEIKIQRYPDNK